MRAQFDSRPGPAAAPALDRRRRRLLHVFPSFCIGGMQRQFTLVAKRLGGEFEHVVVPLDGRTEARILIRGGTACDVVEPPHVPGDGLLGRLHAIRTCLRQTAPSVVVTYNWGAVEWCFANRLFGVARGIHCEHGFGLEEADRPLRRRSRFRRTALGRSVPLVVPSQALMRIATEDWHVPKSQVRLVPNGIDVDDMARRASATPGPVPRRDDEILVGCLAPLRPEKNVARLLRAFAAVAAQDPRWRLAIAGDGPEHARLEIVAQQLRIRHRVLFLGWLDDPASFLASVDVVALSSDTEQLPFSLLEAAALARPIVATDVGDVREICAQANRAFVVSRGDEAGFALALATLGRDRRLAAAVGEANRARVATRFTEAAMADGFLAALRACLPSDLVAASPVGLTISAAEV